VFNELQGKQNIHREIGTTIVQAVQVGKRSLIDFTKHMLIEKRGPGSLQTSLYFGIHRRVTVK